MSELFNNLLNNGKSVNVQWFLIKKHINSLILNHSKKVKLRYPKGNQYPWFDKHLFKLKRTKEKLYFLWLKDKSNIVQKNAFQQAKINYNKLYRSRMVDYFTTKSASDFKNSIKFWEFYSKSIKLKNDSDGNKDKFCINYNGNTITDKSKLSNVFAEFFSNLKSASTTPIDLCKKQIFDHFKFNKIGISEDKFKF